MGFRRNLAHFTPNLLAATAEVGEDIVQQQAIDLEDGPDDDFAEQVHMLDIFDAELTAYTLIRLARL